MSNISRIYINYVIDIDKLLEENNINKIAIPCKTESFARTLMLYFNKKNIIWCSSYCASINDTRWRFHEKDTVYYINKNKEITISSQWYYNQSLEKHKDNRLYIDIKDEDKIIFI